LLRESWRGHIRLTLPVLIFFTIILCIVESAWSVKQILYKQFNILSGRVNVQANLFAYEGWDVKESPYDFEILVTYGKKQFRISSIIIGVRNIDEAVSQIKESTGWKDNYLFVPSECGGGNAWRCNTEHVFAIRQDQLVRIGETRSDDGKPGSSYKNGYFYDVYDRLEENGLTSHVDSPIIDLVMKEKGGRFIVDLERTWHENLYKYERNLEEIRRVNISRGDKQSSIEEFLIAPVLFNAALAKYCHHQKEFEDAIQEAKSNFRIDKFQIFEEILTKVVPGELRK